MARVTITGSEGVIGAILMRGLEGHKLTGLDLPHCDLRSADLRRAFRRQHAVVHLAWNTRGENAFQANFDPANALIGFRVYEAAVAARVRRVVVASSVHADGYESWRGPGLLGPERPAWPDSPYGADKLFMEALGRFYAAHRGLEVVCIRFGGVSRTDGEPAEPRHAAVWLRHDDCLEAVARSIEAPEVPGGFSVFYAVSESTSPLVDPVNPLGWRPRPRAE